MKRYGQSTPPIYDLKQIAQIPIALFVGDKDPLANQIDSF